MAEPIVTKQCSKCNRELPLDSFSIQRGRAYDRHSWCKECYRIHRRPNPITLTPAPLQNKQCGKCRMVLPISHFCRHRRTKDGWDCWCKQCKADYENSNSGQSARQRALVRYRKTPKYKAGQRRHYLGNKCKIRHRRQNKLDRKRHPERWRARSVVSYAIRRGQLPHPTSVNCAYCGDRAEEYHHHLGYARKHWLDVIPLCLPCHTKADRQVSPTQQLASQNLLPIQR